MTKKDGKLSLSGNVNLKKILGNTKTGSKVLQDGSKSKSIQVEIRRKRGHSLSSAQEVVRVEHESNNRLQELVEALKKEEGWLNSSRTKDPEVSHSVSEVSSNPILTASDITDEATELLLDSSGDNKLLKTDKSEVKEVKKAKKYTAKKQYNKLSKSDLLLLAQKELDSVAIEGGQDDVSVAQQQGNKPLNWNENKEQQVSAELGRPLKSQSTKKKLCQQIKIYDQMLAVKLAHSMGVAFDKISKKIYELSKIKVDKQSVIGLDVSELIVHEFGYNYTIVKQNALDNLLKSRLGQSHNLLSRPPIVTVMGHVDHGKTTLLSMLYNSDLVSGEFGKITQHIGAYQVDYSGRKITFIDTPGHEAFAQIRANGAQVTDIIVLVVAANDSVKPQTVEAINHAKLANVPIIVAINKIDLPDVNLNRIKQDLLNHNVIVEELGGDVIVVPISAIKKQNLDKLMEAILLQADVMELTANPQSLAQAFVIEVKMKLGQGILVSIINLNGTLKIGDVFILGKQFGKIKSIIDDKGRIIKTVLPSQPVQIVGVKSLPQVGEKLIVVESEAQAQKIVHELEQGEIKLSNNQQHNVDFLLGIQQSQLKKANIVLKADAYGSIDGIIFALMKILDASGNAIFNAVHTGIGAVNESDVMLAYASNAMVIGFNVDVHSHAREKAKSYKVNIKKYKIIYDLVDELQQLYSDLNEISIVYNHLGKAEVLRVFDFKKYKVAGCILKSGAANLSDFIYVMHKDDIVFKGKISSLRILQDSTDRIEKIEQEFGLIAKGFNDFRESDLVYFTNKLT